MGIFDAKYCAICGEKIGLLGNRKLEDANLCKKCASLLSPFLTNRRKHTLADIREHLAYREGNRAKVDSFIVSKTLGERTKVYVDEKAGNFIVSASRNWQQENPDVIPIEKVTGCDSEIKETRTEVKMKDSEGNQISFDPPRYDIEYDFYFKIYVNLPWFNEIEFQLNTNRVEAQNPAKYLDYDRKIAELKEVLNPTK